MKKLLTLCVLFAFACTKVSENKTVTIFAASSLKELATEVANEWSQKSGIQTQLQFEASSTLARQIKEGAPADVFLTAAPEWLDQVKTLEKFDWLSNQLVCVARKDYVEVPLKDVSSLAIANEQVPAGKYAKAALEKMGISLPARTIYGSNVRDVLSKVSSGAAQVGIVYATDVAMDPELKTLFFFRPDSHPKILYSAGLLTEKGREFYKQLSQSWVLEKAKKRGFLEIQ